MANSIYLKNKKSEYVKCLNSVIATANNLQISIKILESIVSFQGKSYTIDETSAAKGYLSNLLEKEKKIYSNIINNVIPGTKSIISNLEYKIRDAVAEEKIEAQG